MSLSDIVSVSITAQTRTPTQVGFGTPLIAAYHTVFPERTRIYESVTDMLTDGFASTDPAVLAATAVFAQNPRPEQVIVGRTENDEVKTIKVTPNSSDLRASKAYEVYLDGQLRYFTTDASPTVAEICTGLEAALEPPAWTISTSYTVGKYVTNDATPKKVYRCTTAGTSAGSGGPKGVGSGIVDNTCVWEYVGSDLSVKATDNTTYVTVEGDTVADDFRLYVSDPNILWTNDVTADGSPSGIAADLAAISVENDDWYGLISTNQGKAVVTAAAAYIETLKKIFVIASMDSDIAETGSGDLASALETAGYVRTMVIYHYKANEQYPDAAWVGKCLPKSPGSITWKFKSLAGVDYMTLTATKENNIRGKHCNYYTQIAGLSITQEGWTSGDEWMDITNGSDFICARMQEYIFGALANADKIPFTDKGIAVVEGQVWAVLRLAVKNDILVDDENLTVTVPLADDVPVADRANRLLPDVQFEGRLAGAIHAVTISGVVSP